MKYRPTGPLTNQSSARFKRWQRRAVIALCWVAAQLWAQSARAEGAACALPPGASAALGERDPASRLRFIRQSLRDTVRQETFYLGGWSLIYGGIAAGTWIFVPLSDDVPGQMKESAWNSATAVGAAVLMMIEPLRVRSDQQQLERLLAKSAQPESCAVLKEAERLFAHVAESEINSRGALMHLGNFAVNVGLGLVLGYGLKRPDSAGMNTMIGTVLGELMIVTRPTLAARRIASYRSGELSVASQKEPLFNLVPAPIPGGVTLALTGAF